jgi:cobalt-zinc-cadmium efflux system membrane fusion protein
MKRKFKIISYSLPIIGLLMFYECKDHGKTEPVPAVVSSKDENVVTLTDAQLKMLL